MTRTFLLLPLLVAAAFANPVPVGPGKVTVDVGVPLDVYTHKPAAYRDGPLILVFHGVQRNAAEYRDWAAAMAERFGGIVAAPHFDKERFPVEDYQRGGVLAKDGRMRPMEQWTYAAVPKIIAALRASEGRPGLPVYIIGHSAGGQFVQRMAALFPAHGAERIIAANPGTHIFPRHDWPYGFGFGGLGAGDADLKRYLAAPLTLYLGTGDTDPNHQSLTRDEDSMRQGPHRYARGLALWDFAQRLAQERGWPINWRKVETPGVGHDAAKMFAAKEIADALFGADRPR
jgi:poly(3-hydroxybutyrate) depolymerase